jgi:peptidyl-prolyl cis-trans isomerase C
MPLNRQSFAFVNLGRARHLLAWLLLAVGAGCSPVSDESPILVIVNGRPITQGEFDFRWSELSAAAQARYRAEGGKRKFLDDLITRELLLQEARKLGLDQSPRIRERLERYKEQLALDELMQATVRAPVEITKEEQESYFTAHSAELLSAEQVHAAHILVPTLAQAKDLKRQLDEGADFAKLAQRFSIDQATRQKGGDLGPYRRGVAGPEVEAALLTLKPGLVSEPIETQAGVHLVKLISRDPGNVSNPYAARERLRQELHAEKQRKRFEEFLSKLRTAATVRMADASKLVTEDAGPPPAAATP